MKRGDIWWAELSEPLGRRPVVLISRNLAIQVREAVTVAQITTVVRDIPVEVKLNKQDGMPKDCAINCDVLLTIPKKMLLNFVTSLSPQKKKDLEKALKFALGLS
ncbi:MAG: type II toxin-antitoxin system PemK/MazF family toxin [Elusimicrobiota bacterium]